MKKLTDRQSAVLDFLRREHRRTGIMPSTREIQEHFGFNSQTAAVDHLKALEKKGFVKRLAGKARALVLREKEAAKASSWSGAGLLHLPVFGSIPAGMAVESEQMSGESLPVAAEGLGLSEGEENFVLRVRGDSMEGAHILDGDLVVLARREPRNGDIVAALIDGETTLKRFVCKSGKTYLKAENSRYPDQHPATNLSVQGVMVALLRPSGR